MWAVVFQLTVRLGYDLRVCALNQSIGPPGSFLEGLFGDRQDETQPLDSDLHFVLGENLGTLRTLVVESDDYSTNSIIL